jgi:hypothetical protein
LKDLDHVRSASSFSREYKHCLVIVELHWKRWYHRNSALNGDYWFNNRDLAPDPVTLHRSNASSQSARRQIQWSNQHSKMFSGKDRAFFFVNYEEVSSA